MSCMVARRMENPAGRSCWRTIRVKPAALGYVSRRSPGSKPAHAAAKEKCAAGMSICPECA
eukprot:6690398-Prymnesium_polylepis.1